jgi:hypothetical protein
MMGKIYERAQTVIIWLGREDEHLAGAAKVIGRLSSVSPKARRRLQNLNDPDLLENLGIEPQQWVDYALFLQRRWFSRIWVVQESFFSQLSDCERSFGLAKLTITSQRHRLQASTVEMLQSMKNWLRNGVATQLLSAASVGRDQCRQRGRGASFGVGPSVGQSNVSVR